MENFRKEHIAYTGPSYKKETMTFAHIIFIFAHIAKSTKKKVNKTHSKNTNVFFLNKHIVFCVPYEKLGKHMK
jgi:hypothetical protein